MIFFIDYGTAGTAGCYVDSYYESGFSEGVLFFTSYYHKSNYAKNIFFKYSDLAANNFLKRNNFLRLGVRVFEFCFSTFEICINIKKRNASVIIYALSRNTILDDIAINIYKYIFGCKIIIIAHDVYPFGVSSKTYSNTVSSRFKLFSKADELIVHSHVSKNQLEIYFSNTNKQINYFPFPIFNLQNFLGCGRILDSISHKEYVLFIGHIREEKGIDLLIDSWPSDIDNRFLVIAGLWPNDLHKKYFGLIQEKKNIILINSYLDDCDMVELIQNSKFVILPYRFGTNSGILSMCIGLGKVVLVSSIPMFNDYFGYKNIYVFDLDDINSLQEKIISLCQNKDFKNFNINHQQEFLIQHRAYFSVLLNKFKVLNEG
jgi:glycosyltransferase involved in cell wall biosynthesis